MMSATIVQITDIRKLVDDYLEAFKNANPDRTVPTVKRGEKGVILVDNVATPPTALLQMTLRLNERYREANARKRDKGSYGRR